MNYKRILLLVLLIGLTAVIVSCGGSESALESTEAPAVEETAPEENASDSIEAPPMSTGSEGARR